MPFAIDNENDLNPVHKFYYGNIENDEWVELRVANDETVQNIRRDLGIKTTTKHVFNPKTKQMNAINDINLDEDKMMQFNDRLLDYQIANWHILEPSGKEIPCILENKKKLMYGSPQFSTWINKLLSKMNDEIEEVAEAEIKNY